MISGAEIVSAARKRDGAPYVLGAKGPDAFDCSGLWHWALAQLGVAFPVGTADRQIALCVPVPVEIALATPGAMLHYPGHNAISLGDGRTIEARNPALGVGINPAAFNAGRFTSGGLVPGITYSEEAAVPTLLYPLAGGRVTSAFNPKRRNPVTEKIEPHLGADIGDGRGYGSLVLSPVSGVVLDVVTGRRAGQASTTGPTLAPGRSGNGTSILTPGGVVVMVQHLTPRVRPGDQVTAGQPIGVTDPSGIQSGAHVHLELWPTGKPASATDPALYLTHPTTGTGTGGGGSIQTPTTSEEDDMTPAQAQQLAETTAVVGQLRDLLMVPGTGYGYPQATLNAIRSEVSPAIAAVAAGGIRWPGAPYSAFQAVVDAIRDPNLRTTADVDEAALARTLAPLITAQVAALTDEDVARIATAAADEHARRLTHKG